MIDIQNQLIVEAKERYGEISPCGEKKELSDCFTFEKSLGIIVFWFNTSDKSTRALIREA